MLIYETSSYFDDTDYGAPAPEPRLICDCHGVVLQRWCSYYHGERNAEKYMVAENQSGELCATVRTVPENSDACDHV